MNKAKLKKQIASLSAEINAFWNAMPKSSTPEIDAKTRQLGVLRQEFAGPVVLPIGWHESVIDRT